MDGASRLGPEASLSDDGRRMGRLNGDLYVSTDFGVMKLAGGSSDWQVAGDGLPTVEVTGLTIVPGARKLYAATHGLSAWRVIS